MIYEKLSLTKITVAQAVNLAKNGFIFPSLRGISGVKSEMES